MISKKNFWIIWGILTCLTFIFMTLSLVVLTYRSFLEFGSIEDYKALAYLFAEINSYIFYNLTYTLVIYFINFKVLIKNKYIPI